MNVAVLFTGGKDSTYSLYLAMKIHNVKYLVTISSRNPESFMFHTPNIKLTKLQAKLIRIPIIFRETMGIKEQEVKDLKNALKKLNIDCVVSGAIASNYQKTRVDRICKELKLKHIAPLWHKDPAEILNNMVNQKFEIIITSVAAPPMNESWLGRTIDKDCVNDLIKLNKEFGINISGEGGEYETLVLDCPLFSKKISIIESKKYWDRKTQSSELKIRNADCGRKK